MRLPCCQSPACRLLQAPGLRALCTALLPVKAARCGSPATQFRPARPHNQCWGRMYKTSLGPIVLPPIERLLPQGTSFNELVFSLPKKIQLAPTRAVRPSSTLPDSPAGVQARLGSCGWPQPPRPRAPVLWQLWRPSGAATVAVACKPIAAAVTQPARGSCTASGSTC